MNDIQKEIEILLGQLHKIRVNLNKAPSRRYLKSTIKNKLNISRSLYNDINNKLVAIEHIIDSKHCEFLIKATRAEFSEIQLILKTKLSEHMKPVSFKSTVYAIILSNYLAKTHIMAFDMKTATSIVQTYDGTADNLDAFIDAANLLKDYVKNEQVATAVRFLRTRLTGKARLGLPENLNTIDAIINDVKARCSEQVSPENILAKLKSTKQKGDANSLCDEVDNLTNKLKSIYVGQGIPDGVAKSMATKAGVDALINGVNNFETKLILKAGNFSNIKEAVQKVQENNSSTQTNSQNSAQVMTCNTQRNNFYRNNRGRRFNNRGGNSSTPRDRNNQHNNRNNNRQQGRYQHQNNNNNNNYYNRGGRRDNRPRQVYATNAAQVQPVVQNMPFGPYAIPQAQNLQQIAVPAGTPQQNLNFLCRANQGPTPQQQFIQ